MKRKCWWCRRKVETMECRLKNWRIFIPLCRTCQKGFKEKIMEKKEYERGKKNEV